MTSTPVASRELTAERAQEALETLIRDRGIPGAGFAAARDGHVVVNVAAGLANVDTGLAATPDTIWQPGSIGKTYTAVLVMQLVDEGLLDLDTPVRTYLPDLRFADPRATATVTARQLLAHLSGIDGDRLDEDGSDFGRGDDAIRRYVESLGDLPQILEAGRLWSYCNAGYVVLGRIVEVLRGTTYERALKEHVLQPAGLTNTFCFAEDVIQRNVSAGHVAAADGQNIVFPVWMPGRANGPAGTAVVTTMPDLLGFAEILIRGGVAANGARILSEASVAEMKRPHAECPERELLGDQWGLGLLIKTGTPAVYGHDGNTHGQTAALRLIPDSNIAFALITNRAQANTALADLSNRLIDEWAGITTEPRRPAPAGLQLSNPNRYTGTYANVAAAITVALQEQRLTISIKMKRDSSQGIDEHPRLIRPIDDSTFLVHFEEVGDDVQLTFLEPDDQSRPQYLHFGARLFRRT